MTNMNDKMTVRIEGISDQTLDSIIEAIGSRSIAECDIEPGEMFDIILNPEHTTIETMEIAIKIIRTDTHNICYLSKESFNEVIIC